MVLLTLTTMSDTLLSLDGLASPTDLPNVMQPSGPLGASSYRTWYDGLMMPVGSVHLPHMATFFRALPWWELAPNATAIQWGRDHPSNSQRPAQKVSPDLSVVVAYLPHSSAAPPPPPGPPGPAPLPVVCRGGGHSGDTSATLNPALSYTAKWFDPRTGEYTSPKGAQPVVGATAWAVPTVPDISEDWVLLLQGKPKDDAASDPTVEVDATAGAIHIQFIVDSLMCSVRRSKGVTILQCPG
jgi:hypothetical protein